MLRHGGRLKYKESKDEEESAYLRRIQRNSQNLVIDRHSGFYCVSKTFLGFCHEKMVLSGMIH